MTMRTFSTFDEITAATGQEIGTSDWFEIDQDRVDVFAEVTGDHQWIHVDRERAAAGPFGAPIAHGYLTLSLIPHLGNTVFHLNTPGARLNYGLDKVRFPNPVRVGGKVRDRVTFGELSQLPVGRRLTVIHTIELQGETKPACIAQTILLLLEN